MVRVRDRVRVRVGVRLGLGLGLVLPMVAMSKNGWPLHPDPKSNLLATFLPCPQNLNICPQVIQSEHCVHLSPLFLVRWRGGKEGTKRKVKVKVVMRYDDDDDDDDGGRPISQISKFQNNGSAAFRGWKNRQCPNRGWIVLIGTSAIPEIVAAKSYLLCLRL